jgi:antitoxin MazE
MPALVRKPDHSSGVIIPRPILSQIGVGVGDDLDLSLDDGRIVLAPVKLRRKKWSYSARSASHFGQTAPDAAFGRGATEGAPSHTHALARHISLSKLVKQLFRSALKLTSVSILPNLANRH